MALFLFWFVTAVWAPLVVLPRFLRSEEILFHPLPVLWFSVAAVPLFALVTAVWFGGRRRFLTACLAGVAYLGLSYVTFRWGIPTRWPPHGGELLFGLPLVLVGAFAGSRLAPRRPDAPPLVTAVLTVLLGIQMTWTVLEKGADLSLDPDSIAEAPVTAPGRYALYAVHTAPSDSRCRVPGAEVAAVPVEPKAPGYDATPAVRWIAEVTVREPGAYVPTCRTDVYEPYYLGALPKVDGLVGRIVLLPVPRPALLLVGALPGLLLVARAWAARRKPRD